MFFRPIIFLILLLSISTFSLPQSCVVYKKEKDGIFIGADTRMVTYINDEKTQQVETSYSSLCKIEQVNNFNFAITGHGGNISLDEARKACRNEKLLPEVVKYYAVTFGQKLADMLETDRHTKPAFYKKKFLAGRNLGGSLFFHYENGVLIGLAVKFVLVSQPQDRATISTHTENMDSIGIMGSEIGIKRIVFNKDVWNKGTVNAINNLIGIEKMANPVELGGIVDILFVSNKNQLEWIQRKACN